MGCSSSVEVVRQAHISVPNASNQPPQHESNAHHTMSVANSEPQIVCIDLARQSIAESESLQDLRVDDAEEQIAEQGHDQYEQQEESKQQNHHNLDAEEEQAQNLRKSRRVEQNNSQAARASLSRRQKMQLLDKQPTLEQTISSPRNIDSQRRSTAQILPGDTQRATIDYAYAQYKKSDACEEEDEDEERVVPIDTQGRAETTLNVPNTFYQVRTQQQLKFTLPMMPLFSAANASMVHTPKNPLIYSIENLYQEGQETRQHSQKKARGLKSIDFDAYYANEQQAKILSVNTVRGQPLFTEGNAGFF